MSAMRVTSRERPRAARIRQARVTPPATRQQRIRPRHGENRWRRECVSELSDSCPEELLQELMGDSNSTRSLTATPFPTLSSANRTHSKLTPVTPHYHFVSSPSPEDNPHLPTITVTNPENMVMSQSSPAPHTPAIMAPSPVCLSLPALLTAERKLPELPRSNTAARRLMTRSGRRGTHSSAVVKLPAIHDSRANGNHTRTRSFSDGAIEKLPLLINQRVMC